jgi:acetylxylan esterase
MDDAFCGGGDLTTPFTSAARAMIKAAIFMGDPRHIPGLPYNVGTCNAKGVGYRRSGDNFQVLSAPLRIQYLTLHSSHHGPVASLAKNRP